MFFLIAFLVFIIIIILLLMLSYKMYKAACKRSDTTVLKSKEMKTILNDDRVVTANIDWLKVQDIKDINIKSNDGLKLHGVFLPASNPYRTVICVHGYRGQYERDFSAIIRYFNANHSNVLLIEQRCHGESEGEIITFGAKESEDLNLWINYVTTRLDDKNPIYLYGISMGASTCLLTLKNKLIHQVKGVIADCGYTSMEYVCSHLCRSWYHLPAFLFMYFIKMYCSVFGGFDMDSTNVVTALKDNEIPILYIHGDADTFVVPENTRINYSATTAPKDIVWIEGANHGECIFKNPTLYHDKLEYFFNTYR